MPLTCPICAARLRVCGFLLATAAMTGSLFVGSTHAAKPAPAAPTTQGTAAFETWSKAMQAFHDVAPDFAKFQDPAYRQEVRPKLTVAFKANMDAFAEVQKDPSGVPPIMPALANYPFVQDGAVMWAVGDEQMLAKLKADAVSPDPHVAFLAKAKENLGDLLAAGTDQTRIKALDGLEETFKAAPAEVRESIDSSFVCLALTNLTKKLSQPVQDRRDDLLAAQGPKSIADSIKKKRQQAQTSDTIINKPIVLNGTTPEGKALTTADWKGKVILVDFWATWCAPCKAELPRVRAMYDKYHEQGLEVLGVSNDFTKAALTNYVQTNSLPWPNLYNTDDDGTSHPLTKKYNISGIPKMFLIDRQGVLRSVEARSEMEDLIPKLLAEAAH